MGYIEGVSRDQTIRFPDTLDEYISPDNPVRFIDAYVDYLDLDAVGFGRTETSARFATILTLPLVAVAP